MKFADIVPFSTANYQVNIGWWYLENAIKEYRNNYGLELEPDFQRAHVWTDLQATRYVEHRLRRGMNARELYFNCPNWGISPVGPLILVDGLQRLTAVRRFLRGELRPFGHTIVDFNDKGRIWCDFIFAINDLPDRAAVLRWYIDLNAGGVVHSETEIQRVRQLLSLERNDGR